MPNFRQFAAALALVASVACSNSVDLADPNVIARELPGTWSRIIAPGSSTVLQLSVHDSTITGTGTFAGEAGPSGTLVVTGRITTTGDFGPFVNIDFAQSNGPIGHFTGRLKAADTLDGSIWYTATGFGSDPVPGTFIRTSH
jgi:hypothetical protein